MLFILALGGLSNQETARRGNIYGIIGMAIALVAMALADVGVESESYTGSQAGFLTDTNHTNAKILQVRAERIRAAVDARDELLDRLLWQPLLAEALLEPAAFGQGADQSAVRSIATPQDAVQPALGQAWQFPAQKIVDALSGLLGIDANLAHFAVDRIGPIFRLLLHDQ